MKNILTLLLAVFLLSACGSGGSRGDESSSQVKTGLFIDAPVEGLNYETPSFSGKTDTYGSFRYKSGETVTFKIGNMPIGSAKGSDIVTPLTLAGDTDINNISTKAVNIARLLQTLNANNSDNVSIRIPSALNALSVDNVDFSYEQDLERIIQAAESATSSNYVLIDSDEALNHMRKYILAYSTYKPIDRIYNTDTGTKYKLLSLKNNTRLYSFQDCSPSHNLALQMSSWESGVLIYDLELNFIRAAKRAQVTNIPKGTYILKLLYDSREKSTIIINSPELFEQTSFPQLKNGTNINQGTVFYNLTMAGDGNIIFDDYYGIGTPSKLYDTDLNYINDLDRVTYLEKGTYVVVFHHGNSRPLNIQSLQIPD